MKRSGHSGWVLGIGSALVLALPVAISRGEEPAVPDVGASYEDYDDLYFESDDADVADSVGDPLEPVNRGIFAMNDGLDRYVVGPVSTAWDWVMPDFAERALRNAFDNLRFPVVFANHLLQGKPKDAGVDVARFLMNTTVGIAGLMDPAAAIGLRKGNEDFGQTLGVWGVPPGPYLMLPLLGPSTIRDGSGLIVDAGLAGTGFFIPIWASVGARGLDALNRRSLIGDTIDAEREAALDWYAAVRSGYLQHRENLVNDQDDSEDNYDLFPVIAPGAPEEKTDANP